jgi:hypothetical protein
MDDASIKPISTLFRPYLNQQVNIHLPLKLDLS